MLSLIMRKFRLNKNFMNLPENTIVYEYTGPTYGLIGDHEYLTNIPHRSVTLNYNRLSFIVLPKTHLEEIKLVS